MGLEPLDQRWRSFGWRVLETDGHDFDALLSTIDKARQRRTRPTVVIAHTVKGKGVSFMENTSTFHGRAPTADEMEKAMQELA
jgi:transketolase